MVWIGSWFYLKRLAKRFTKITQPHWNVIMMELLSQFQNSSPLHVLCLAGSALQHFLFKVGSIVVQCSKWMNPIVLQCSKVDWVSQTFQKPWLSRLSKLRLHNYAKAAFVVHLRFFCVLTFGHNPIVLICIFLLPFTWRSSQLRRDCVVLSL